MAAFKIRRQPRKPSEEERSQTRVYIKNLPSDLTVKGLTEFVTSTLKLSVSDVTDCRILKRADGTSRRVAFCGFLTKEQASLAVEKLNKAYCETSRLFVEFALLPRKTESAKVDHNENAEPAVQPSHVMENEIVDKKKQEFLAVMGVTTGTAFSKRKAWANDDDGLVDHENAEAQSDHDSSETDSDDDDDDDHADPLLQEKSSSSKATGQSDMDFLLSKRVDVDDFEEDDKRDSRVDRSDEDDSDSSDIATKQAVIKEADEESGSHNMTSSDGDHQLTNESLEKESLNSTCRLFLRNLPFSVTESDIKLHMEQFGTITECHVPVDDQKRSKGFAFCTYQTPSAAKEALAALDGTDFKGRLLHVLPAQQPRTSNSIDEASLSFKERQERKRQREATKDENGWSASFVRSDAVVDNLATRLGLNKGEILSVKDGLSSGDAAVRLALGETAIIEENRDYFAKHGIDMEALVSFKDPDGSNETTRSTISILVKNLPHDTTEDDLLKVFGSAGESPARILLPPSRTIAVVEYKHTNDAKKAFRKLAYKRFKNVPLYLEWAPLASHISSDVLDTRQAQESLASNENEAGAKDTAEDDEVALSTTIHVKNLNFATTEERLKSFFEKYARDIRAVRIPTKVAPVKTHRQDGKADDSVRTLSMGFGFVEFISHEKALDALKGLQGSVLDGHKLDLQPSNRGSKMVSAHEVTVAPNKKNCKLVVRNVPFQASRKELLQLFGSFGQLKKVRLPKKFDGSHRGFAFVEYMTPKEAAAAQKSLSRTHLYGRHLVIEWAVDEDENDGASKPNTEANHGARPNKKVRFG